jgi:hypothetical protein
VKGRVKNVLNFKKRSRAAIAAAVALAAVLAAGLACSRGSGEEGRPKDAVPVPGATATPPFDPGFAFRPEISIMTSPDRYSPLMPSATGIILSVKGQAEGAATLKYEASSGSFGLFKDGINTGLGNPADRKFGDIPAVHWSPDGATKDGDAVTVSLLGEGGDVLAQVTMAVSVQDDWYSLIPTSKPPARREDGEKPQSS